MEIEFSPRALIDLEKWKKSGNILAQRKITDLTNSILITPFKGIGKPEPLKYQMSRRNTPKDRYVYEISGDKIIVHSLIGHY